MTTEALLQSTVARHRSNIAAFEEDRDELVRAKEVLMRHSVPSNRLSQQGAAAFDWLIAEIDRFVRNEEGYLDKLRLQGCDIG